MPAWHDNIKHTSKMVNFSFFKLNPGFGKKESPARPTVLSDDIEDVKYEEVHESANPSAHRAYDKMARESQIFEAAYEYAEKSSKDDPFLLISHAALFVEAAKWCDGHPETGCMPLEWAQKFHQFYNDTLADIQGKASGPIPSALKTLILLVFTKASNWARENPPQKQ